MPELNLEDILADRLREDDLIEVPLDARVFRGFWVLILLFAGIAVFRFFNLGLANHDFYENRALANMSYSLSEPAPRGVIYDRNGLPLAENEPVFDVFLVPHELPKEKEKRAEVLLSVAQAFGLEES